MANKDWAKVSPPLSSSVIDCINKQGFKTMTPVQGAVIPLLLSCKDVIAEAVTGSGKTLAFVVPMLEMLLKKEKSEPLKKDYVYCVIISPTRELATQICNVIKEFLLEPALSQLRVALLVGGTSVEADCDTLQEGAHIAVATPGRLMDLLDERKILNLAAKMKQLELLILDEADRLLDLGFSATLTTILEYLPRQRRTGLFSATQTKELQDLVRAGLRNPVAVTVKEKSSISTPIALQNYYIIVEPQDKFVYLMNFIRNRSNRSLVKGLFFVPTCACVDYWADILAGFLPDLKIHALHGKMKQNRNKVLEEFRNTDGTILVCTDLLARGVDIPEVEWVLQWEPPTQPETFVHRVGRAARAGKSGYSLLPLLPTEDAYVQFIKNNQKVELVNWTDSMDKITKTNKVRDKILKVMHNLQMKDRGILDKGQKAFVSHMRAYSKHECNLLLQLKELPLGHIATSYGLLKLPLMPEINNTHKEQFVGPKEDVVFNDIPYKDKQKEASRQIKLQQFNKTGVWPSKKSKKVQTKPWEKANIMKEERKSRKRKRKEVKASGGKVKKSKCLTQEEINELAADVALINKLKKKKITQEEFDNKFTHDDED